MGFGQSKQAAGEEKVPGTLRDRGSEQAWSDTKDSAVSLAIAKKFEFVQAIVKPEEGELLDDAWSTAGFSPAVSRGIGERTKK